MNFVHEGTHVETGLQKLHIVSVTSSVNTTLDQFEWLKKSDMWAAHLESGSFFLSKQVQVVAMQVLLVWNNFLL